MSAINKNRTNPVMLYKVKAYLRNNFEATCWIVALTALYFMPENNNGFTLCPFHWLGFKYCPGCGIGHAIHYAMHFKFVTSFHSHPLGIAGLITILLRIKQLVFKTKPQYEQY